jgi:uncharacterized protein DUF5666
MRQAFTTFMIVGALALSSAAFAGAAAQKSGSTAKHTASTSTASHAVRGVVKSIDDSSLVVTASGKKTADMTFVVNSSTTKEGSPAVGSTVSVRYKTEGGKMVATAVAVQPAAASHSSKPKTGK